MQVARTAYLLNAFEAAKFMLRTGTTLAPSASAITVTRSPHSPSRRGISAPRRCCSHRSETSSHERGLRRSKPAHLRNAVAKSRAGPTKAVGRFWVAGFPAGQGHRRGAPARAAGRRRGGRCGLLWWVWARVLQPLLQCQPHPRHDYSSSGGNILQLQWLLENTFWQLFFFCVTNSGF